MILTYHKIQLRLKETFSIAYGDYQFREALIVSLSHQEHTGYGECTGIDYYGIDLDSFMITLDSLKKRMEQTIIVYPVEFYQLLNSLGMHPFLRSAIDCAYWDLYGKLENKTFEELNNIPYSDSIESSITISVDTIDQQIKKIEASSWSKFKVKCNGLDKDHINKLGQLGKNVALDSNGSFTEADCIWLQENEISKSFSYLEQPMPKGSFSILKADLFANWMADEDSQNSMDLDILLPHYKSINIKLMKCGGLTPALEMIKKARVLGYKIMIGCMTESTVGISAGIAIASLVDYADLDGANLIANDIANGSKIVNGKIIYAKKKGLGISLK